MKTVPLSSSLIAVLIIGSVSFISVLGAITPCNQGNQAACLDAVIYALTTEEWWFGDTYSAVCPESRREADYECFNPLPDRTSIASRLLIDVTNITQVLRIRYNVPGGSYLSCGNAVSVPSVYMATDLDPTVTQDIDLWTLSHQPAVTWSSSSDDVYTLYVYDVGTMKLSGAWANIVKGNLAFGKEFYPYSGPESGLDRDTFLVFLLFKQSGLIPTADFPRTLETILEASTRAEPSLPSSSPSGIGLVRVRTDSYGIEQLRQRKLLNNCPWLIQRSRPEVQTLVDVHRLAELGANVTKLEVDVTVHFYSDQIEISFCGENVTEPSMLTRIDPLSRSLIKPVYLRYAPLFRLSRDNLLDEIFQIESFFTLMLLDVTSAVAYPWSRDHTSLLWLVTDFWDPYPSGRGLPPDTTGVYYPVLPRLDVGGSSTYAILIFRQKLGEMGPVSLASYCADMAETNASCSLNLYQYVKDKDLHLSGVSLLNSEPDLYSRMALFEMGLVSSMEEACADLPTVNTSTAYPAPTTTSQTPTDPTATSTEQPTEQPTHRTTDDEQPQPTDPAPSTASVFTCTSSLLLIINFVWSIYVVNKMTGLL